MFRMLFLPIGILASLVVPYLYFNPGVRQQAWERAQNLLPSNNPATGTLDDSFANHESLVATPAAFSTPQVPPNPAHPSPPIKSGTFVGGPITPLAEVMHANVTPSWILSRWPRVSSVYGEAGMEGMRVPLSTGKQPNDLVGSLTYYFNSQGQLRRIQFDGRTGDPRKIMEHVVSKFGFQRVAMKEGFLFTQNWNGVIHGGVRITRRSIVSTESPWDTYVVELEYNVPQGDYGLSRRFYNMLVNDKLIRRW